jgi:hypothetical protein
MKSFAQPGTVYPSGSAFPRCETTLRFTDRQEPSIVVGRAQASIMRSSGHAAICDDRSCGPAPRRLAADGVLPDPRRQAAHDPDAVQFAAGAARIAVCADAPGSGRDHRPRRRRFRYSPLREVPSALAAASTLPSSRRRAALIVSARTRIDRPRLEIAGSAPMRPSRLSAHSSSTQNPHRGERYRTDPWSAGTRIPAGLTHTT